MPKLTEIAASERLFHSVSNEPLDVYGYNQGFDLEQEDEGAEAKWRQAMAYRNLGDVSDMCSVEAYFFNMWNQFINIDCKSSDIDNKNPVSDRASFSIWIRFVRKYGGEIKRMK